MPDPSFINDDLVYVDPETRTVIGRVEWDANGQPKSLPYKSALGKEPWRTHYPWGTYRSMKSAFRIGGKCTEEESALSFNDALPKLMQDAL